MPYQLGPPRSLDDITLEDVLAHPVWLWVWETGHELEGDIDETWQQPIMGTRDVTTEMSEPIISFKVKGTDTYGSGSYDPDEDKLFGMALWVDGRWQTMGDVQLTGPQVFVAIPTIRNHADVEFVCNDLASDEAFRAA